LTDNSRLLLRGDVGYTVINDINLLPTSLSFYAGGAQSIRGFSYEAMGPARYLTVGSIEYQHLIVENWYWATFYDFGNAYNHFFTSGQPSPNFHGFLQQGAGFGVVWRSPIGPLEITLGKALSMAGQPMQIQFTMGPEL
jgi:translocation and assembly module TamA